MRCKFRCNPHRKEHTPALCLVWDREASGDLGGRFYRPMDRERLVIAALATGVAALVVRAHSRRRSDSAQPTTSHTRRKHENIACPPRAHLVLTKEQTERLGEQDGARPISLLVLHNVSKKKNFGELLRSAAAMGVSEVVVVGATKLATHGAQGTAGHLRFTHFSKLVDARADTSP